MKYAEQLTFASNYRFLCGVCYVAQAKYASIDVVPGEKPNTLACMIVLRFTSPVVVKKHHVIKGKHCTGKTVAKIEKVYCDIVEQIGYSRCEYLNARRELLEAAYNSALEAHTGRIVPWAFGGSHIDRGMCGHAIDPKMEFTLELLEPNEWILRITANGTNYAEYIHTTSDTQIADCHKVIDRHYENLQEGRNFVAALQEAT
ncbi:MAG: hypothetical protein GY832_22180 [Chloroflexi bacterium]|nr:hypothetical protein [Chloroflexota bacterium]